MNQDDEYQQDQRAFIEDAMEESDELGGSLTNEVRETYTGTIMKRFEDRPKTAYFQALGKLLGGKVEYETRDDRIENERAYREIAEKAGLYTPDILGQHEEYVEFERVDGDTLPDYLNDADSDEAYEIGERLGESLRVVHDEDYAVTDLRINNIIVTDEDQLASVDHEYATDEATGWDKQLDILTLISSARQVDDTAYESFREGFEHGYDESVDTSVDIMTSATAPLHASLLERDTDRTGNALRNTVQDLGDRLHEYLPDR
ncbi:MAG: hypothetical protein MUP66_00025 [Candidatus Nanohaloarchaeota archaeon QJJ-5]|nr:hypothetical protein [Candidatus Nanohaloarchaeota archaeon QJJ-5]